MFLKSKQPRSPWRFGLPRQVVRHFAGLMEMVLRDNDWKGGWKPGQNGGDSNTIHFFRDKLREEQRELDELMLFIEFGRPVDATQVAHEAADVANIAMMIADNWGRTAEHAICPRCYGTRDNPDLVGRHDDPRIPPTRCRDTFHDDVPAGYKGCE